MQIMLEPFVLFSQQIVSSLPVFWIHIQNKCACVMSA